MNVMPVHFKEQRGVLEAEQLQNVIHHVERSAHVAGSNDDRGEEHEHDLRADALLDFCLAHANLLHDGKVVLVVVSFGNLLVVDDQSGCEGEEQAEEDSEEEESVGEALHQRVGFFMGDAAAKESRAGAGFYPGSVRLNRFVQFGVQAFSDCPVYSG